MVESTDDLTLLTESPFSRWMPAHLVQSAWIQHAPFAYWLVEAARPRTIVELGTHFGFSFFVFAEAVARLGLGTRLSAIDSWEGDDHAGFYGNNVYDWVRSVTDAHYPQSTELVRGYFADVVGHFADGSIDILHIDGRHGYEDALEDLETYRPKLSDRAVVLFHDTNEYAEGFGVFRLWAEIESSAPSFQFLHGHGLGVLAVGANAPARVLAFIEAANGDPGAVRSRYESFGLEVERLAEVLNAEQRARNFEQQIYGLKPEILALRAEIEAMQSSRSWKLTAPLRALRARRPGG